MPTNHLREIRQAHGLTLQQLGEMVGVGQPALSRIETGDRRGLYVTHKCIAAALDLPVDVIFPPS